MIQSMTGIGSASLQTDSYDLSIELKSVNGRFLDLKFKMPSLFSRTEVSFRKVLEKHFRRGSIKISLSWKKKEDLCAVRQISEERVLGFLHALQPILKKARIPLQIDSSLFLQSEFQKEMEEDSKEEIRGVALDLLEDACLDLKNFREEEGQHLRSLFIGHLHSYVDAYHQVGQEIPSIQEDLEKKLKMRLEDFCRKEELEADLSRYRQEIIYYLEKLDIQEELDRIKGHLEKLRTYLERDEEEEVGRPLEFVLQELNRETNTIGSKSKNEQISSAVISMKMALEKMREQSANLQ